MRDRLIVALDYSTLEEAIKMVEVLGESVVFYKVGLELFLNSKGEIIDYLNKNRKKVFLDLKFYDIPNTTMMASLFAVKNNIDIFNVHASGGREMMKKVVSEVKKIKKDTLCIAVTVLTSFSENELREIYHNDISLQELAINMAKISKESGMDGVVCSPLEASKIKEICGKSFKTITPGVRPSWSLKNDQERVMTPKSAIENGSDYLVIGRPITRSENPKESVELILKEMREANVIEEM